MDGACRAEARSARFIRPGLKQAPFADEGFEGAAFAVAVGLPLRASAIAALGRLAGTEVALDFGAAPCRVMTVVLGFARLVIAVFAVVVVRFEDAALAANSVLGFQTRTDVRLVLHAPFEPASACTF